MCRYQKGNQNLSIEEEQTTQWPKAQKDIQRSTKDKYKTKARVTRTPLKTWGEHKCSGRVMTYDVDEKGNESSNKVPTNKWEWRIAHYFVLSVPLRYTDSDYPFGIFKLFTRHTYSTRLH